ncbi:fatty acyl-AMP ligase [Streptomyces beihaiensis]|uniref:Fatty acyl-AMP ligase n=1 Tax=Streptomyces beihaiensis TaxID=2984495 RepID=A0ABT3TWG6_9ACTN|nr:fatty acyl-AMP ligase [Streptomyces beihaiensis]MCX3061386.1 fatty acyl-AMP ligase [Streptomyces beihaiensis]
MFSTFTECVVEQGRALAHQDAHVFVPDDQSQEAQHLTYAGLDAAARTIAVRLARRGARGRPVLLLYPSGQEFLRAFLGCLYAGAIAVPAPLPHQRQERLRRVTGIIRDTGAELILTDSANAPEVSLWLAMSGRGSAVCLATDTDEGVDPGQWTMPDLRPDDLAFLQYTSGSTSQPRGVMVSHRNLLANQRAFRRVVRSTPQDRFVTWLPHYHDLGLIAHLLHPLWLGALTVQMPARSFIKRPVRWLSTIDAYGATIASGPNFAYDLCVRRVTDEQAEGLDLSRWRVALNGAEPIRPETLDAFAARFAPCGLRPEAVFPAYGLAESTLCVSGGVPGSPWRRRTVDVEGLEHNELRPPRPGAPARELVSSGTADEYEVRIVDDARREVAPGHVGEIWLRGDSVAQGYWRQAQESALTFQARLPGAQGTFLRTGDLGALVDGQLYVTGRLKEVIILNGRNLYPQDVEWATREVSSALGSGRGAVFTVHAGHEQLVLVHEVRAESADWERLRALARRVQTAIGKEFEVPASNVVLVRPGTVHRTTSGKIQRSLMRRLFLSGELTGLYEVLDPAVRTMIRPGQALLGDELLGGGADDPVSRGAAK